MSKHVLPGTTRLCCLPVGVIRVPEMATVHFRMSLIWSHIRRRITRMKSRLLRNLKLIRRSLKGLIATSLWTLNAALLTIGDRNVKIKLQYWQKYENKTAVFSVFFIFFFLYYRHHLFISEGIRQIQYNHDK